MNGTLYSLFSNKEINNIAQNMNLENRILEKCQVCNIEDPCIVLEIWNILLKLFARHTTIDKVEPRQKNWMTD